ncbi:catechol O-methyltransferase [Sphaerosporella brunnea]|uniref:Catechol O-methyltransferase n=1 Tax=Sphaerosporella brunnea TaxID=1250544 RepID=A0A5J5F152_9PEZI|nr:catechol O-methyltransferase [Sphaerosporella brunnea]
MPEPVPLLTHLLKNISLLSLSLLTLPLTSTLVAICLLLNFLYPLQPPPTLPSKRKHTVLISSLAMGKGLSLARAFHKAGHTVIGVDFSSTHFAGCTVPSAGRFSRALEKYFTVATPHDVASRKAYEDDMLRLIKAEGVDLWICVSGVASTVEDALLKHKIEKETRCKVFQPSPETVETLHEKHRFINCVAAAGLKVPTTVLVESRHEVFEALEKYQGAEFIIKCVEPDGASRADMTLLPQPTKAATKRFVDSLDISPKKRWVVQQFVRGKEYCTHAVVVKGKVKAFVACESCEMLMAYAALPAAGRLHRAMLSFTQHMAQILEDGNVTGQLSFDFMVEEGEREVTLFPIECNPRTHTAVILLSQHPRMLADAYLSLLGEKVNGELAADTIYQLSPEDTTTGHYYYWVGYELVVNFLYPLLQAFLLKLSLLDALKEALGFAAKVLCWKDAMFETWDPLPWWWLYHVYYPGIFLTSLVTGRRWRRVTVSTTTVYESC